MRRVPELDGLRGVAVLMVLIWHYFSCELPGVNAAQVIAYRLTSLTWSGVDLFFVLSGFLIAGILLDNCRAENYFKVFYARRVFRILPLYVLLLASFAVLRCTRLGSLSRFAWVFANPMPFWSYATFTQNILMGVRHNLGAGSIAITWSLAVEEQFYLVIPLLIYVLNRRLAFIVIVGLALSAPVLRVFVSGFAAYTNTPFRSDALLSGVAIAFLTRIPIVMSSLREHRLFLRIVGGLLLGGVIVLSIKQHTISPVAANPLVFSVLAAFYSVLLLTAYAGGEPYLSAALRSRFLMWLGSISYGVYMIHQSIAGLLFGMVRGSPPMMPGYGSAVLTLTALAVTFTLAVLSRKWIEEPLIRVGQRFEYRVSR